MWPVVVVVVVYSPAPGEPHGTVVTTVQSSVLLLFLSERY